MTWALNASGHLQDKASEEALVEALRGILSKYGAQSSQFGGTFTGLVENLQAQVKAPVASTIAGPKAAVIPEPVKPPAAPAAPAKATPDAKTATK
jgi:hypothetical protein